MEACMGAAITMHELSSFEGRGYNSKILAGILYEKQDPK
jgi:hypothetical protein